MNHPHGIEMAARSGRYFVSTPDGRVLNSRSAANATSWLVDQRVDGFTIALRSRERTATSRHGSADIGLMNGPPRPFAGDHGARVPHVSCGTRKQRTAAWSVESGSSTRAQTKVIPPEGPWPIHLLAARMRLPVAVQRAAVSKALE